MLLPSPEWLNSGNNAWQLAAATFVGLQSIPGLTILYGGIVKKKWAINSAFMSMYAFKFTRSKSGVRSSGAIGLMRDGRRIDGLYSVPSRPCARS